MSALTDRQHEMLARGIEAFDIASGRRRRRRRAVTLVAAASLAIAAGIAALLGRGSGSAGLPGYVEIIRDDAQLIAELELANACERVGRTEGRLIIVECVVHPTAD